MENRSSEEMERDVYRTKLVLRDQIIGTIVSGIVGTIVARIGTNLIWEVIRK